VSKSCAVDAGRTDLLGQRFVVWTARVLWALLAVTMAPALDEALVEAADAVQLVATIGAWASWAAVLGALLVPSDASLTFVRMLAPITPCIALACGVAGASGAAVVVATSSSCVATLLVFSADIGQRFVQASAYGDETRLLLRAPGPLLLGPIEVLWAAWATAVVAGPLLIADGSWLVGSPVALIGAAGTVLLARRLHRLSRRWLVFVPAGVVIHDHLVLTDTAMFGKGEVTAAALAAASTEAADLTGAALGPALELTLSSVSTVFLAPGRGRPNGTALHVRSVLVSPTRPGRAITEANRRGVGRGVTRPG
jgi:hypothetical protein